jgi:multidrug efflux system membrane fusion protein
MGVMAVALAVFGWPGASVLAQQWQGTLDWAQRVALGTPLSGVVTEVLVEPGDAVAAGQVLVRLDDRILQARVRRARAQLAEFAAARAEARRERDRAQELYDRTLLSDRDLELANIAFTEADARYEAGRAQLTEAEVELEYSALRSPFDAWVLKRPAQPGQVIASRLEPPVLVELAARTAMVARLLVAAEELDALPAGAEVEVETGGRRFRGRVVLRGLAPAAGEPPLRYPVEVRFTLPGGEALRAGQPVRVRLP